MSAIVNNTAPAGTTGGGFVGTFTVANATLTLVNTILAGDIGGAKTHLALSVFLQACAGGNPYTNTRRQ